MQWSKRKKRVESFFTDSVKQHVELRSTLYRGTHDGEGRGYITFNKKEIWSMCTQTFYSIEYAQLSTEGEYSQYTFYDSLDQYCKNSIKESLYSENILIRCLAMLDSRFGKRQLKKFDLSKENIKVKEFHEIRCICDTQYRRNTIK